MPAPASVCGRGDTAISIIAGLAVFPIVFANKLDPSSGPGLVIVTLPLAFARMPFGDLAATAFFLLLVVAALASAISLLEMPVAFLQRKLGWRRRLATWICAPTCWLLGLATVMSFNVWAGWFPLSFLPGLAKATLFDLLDHLTSNVLLPLGGLALAVFGRLGRTRDASGRRTRAGRKNDSPAAVRSQVCGDTCDRAGGHRRIAPATVAAKRRRWKIRQPAGDGLGYRLYASNATGRAWQIIVSDGSRRGIRLHEPAWASHGNCIGP
jgi:Sodium:neurotransmitter symporter family